MKNRFLNLILLVVFISLNSCDSEGDCGDIDTTYNDPTKAFSKIIEKYNSLNLGEEKK